MNNETMIMKDKGAVSTENEALLNEYIDGSKIVSYETRELTYPTLSSFYDISQQLSLVEFLGRPTRIAGGTITTATTSLFSIKIPQDILAAANFSQKVYGYAGFKATTVIRLQVNANRFQQGRIILYHHPQLQDKKYIYSASELFMATQLPHAELDLATQTEVIFKIPYVTCTTHYNLVKLSGPTGIVKGTMYSPLLVGAGSSNLQYNVFCYFEDVQLDIPIAQMGAEEQQNQTGPVTSGLRKVDKTMQILSGGFPALSSVVAPVSWVAKVMSKVSDLWGWSKPIDVEKYMRMVPYETGYDNNCDGIDTARSGALFANPNVTVTSDYFNDGIDQMCINYVVQKKSYWKSILWASTNSVGDVLAEIPAAPWSYRGPNVTPAGFTVAYINGLTPLSYLSTMFQQYKGSITFTLKFVKTEFHSGRLLIAWNPYGGATPQYANFTSSAYCLRDVVDIRQCNEFTFTVPYASTTGYTSIQDCFGGITIFVLTELTSPDTVASNISILIEVAGGPDFEFANPVANSYVPRSIPNTDYIAVAQSGHNPDCERPIGIGGSHINVDLTGTSSACVGERILSLKQLLMRTSLMAVQELGALSVSNDCLVFDPFSVFGPSNGVNFSYNYPLTGKDIFSRICCMYNLMRGSVIIRVQSLTNSPFDLGMEAWSLTRVSGTVLAYNVTIGSQSYALKDSTFVGQLHTIKDSKYIQSILVPQYNNLPSRLIAPVAGTTSYDKSVLEVYNNAVHVKVLNLDDAIHKFRIFRQAGDDFHVGFFTYVPNLWLNCPFETP